MKTVIFTGSPHRHGETQVLVDELKKHLLGTVVEYDAYSLKIKPCTDCRYCWKKQGCSIKDDGMLDIYANIEDADNIVVASPLHFGGMTGPLLVLVSRLQTYWSAKYKRKDEKAQLKPKKGVLILTGGTSWPNMFSIGRDNATFIFNHVGAIPIATITAAKTDQIMTKDNTRALALAKKYALELNDSIEG